MLKLNEVNAINNYKKLVVICIIVCFVNLLSPALLFSPLLIAAAVIISLVFNFANIALGIMMKMFNKRFETGSHAYSLAITASIVYFLGIGYFQVFINLDYIEPGMVYAVFAMILAGAWVFALAAVMSYLQLYRKVKNEV